MLVKVISPASIQDNARPSAFMEGHTAKRKGIAVMACPYDMVTDLMRHAAWCSGWLEAEDEMRHDNQARN